MEQSFTNKEGLLVVQEIIHTIQKNRNYLSEVDSVGGDGDHGINMNKGFTIAEKECSENQIQTMSEGFQTISQVLVNKIGGSMGPLYGSFFNGLAIASKKETAITKAVVGKMLVKAYQNISILTEAKIGDKTLMDVLIPAVDSYQESEKEKNFDECLNAMLAAAEIGLESTKQLSAKIGRASRIGNRSIGYQDAGATSCYLILTAITKSMTKLLSE